MSRVHAGTPTERLRDQAATIGNDLRELGHITQESVRETASGLVDEGRKRVLDVSKSVNRYVGQQPVKSLALAAGAGMVLGYLLSRRR